MTTQMNPTDAEIAERLDGMRRKRRLWKLNNPKKCEEYRKRWNALNPNGIKEFNKKYHHKIRSTTIGKIHSNIGSGMSRRVGGLKEGIPWEKLVGYTLEQLQQHLESQFKDGMSWDNYGKKGWHIDHICPLSRLHIESIDDPTFKFAWSLKNLQPLWERDNLLKSNHIAATTARHRKEQG